MGFFYVKLSMLNGFSLHALGLLVPFILIQYSFTHTDVLRCHLNTFVLLNILHALLQCKLCFWRNTHTVITAACTVVGQLLGFNSIHIQISWLDMLGNDLTSIYFFCWVNEETAPIL